MPTLSRHSSRSTLRSPKPPGWSGSSSTKSTPAKAKNGASAALSYVFAEPEMASLGDGLGAANTLSTSASKSVLEEQTPDEEGKAGALDPIPGSPTPARKTTWYGSLSRSRGRKQAQQLGRTGTGDSQPPTVLVPPSPAPTESVLSESPTAVHEAPAAAVVDEESQAAPSIPTTAVREAESAVPPGPASSPNKRRWFSTVSSASPAPAPDSVTEGENPPPAPLAVPERLESTSTSTPTIVLSESLTTVASVLSSSASAPAVPAPQEAEITTTPVAAKRGWFSSTATPAAAAPSAPSAALTSLSPPQLPLPEATTPPTTSTETAPLPPTTPSLVLPAPPDLASVMETLEAGPGPTPPPQPAPESAPAPARRSWFSSYTPSASISTSSLPAPFPAPASPPRPAYAHAHSIPSSLDDEVPALSTLAFPEDVSPSPGMSVGSITPSSSSFGAGSGFVGPASPESASSSALSTDSTETLQPPAQGQGQGRPRLSSLSSLNPSTSRFTLSIPLLLLGRAKVPLPVPVSGVRKEKENGVEEKMQDVPKIVEPTAVENTTSTTKATMKTTTKAMATTSNVPTNSPPTTTSTPPSTSPDPTSQSTEAENTTNTTKTLTESDTTSTTTTTVTASTSWWAYVGWSSSNAESESASAPNTDGDGGIGNDGEIGANERRTIGHGDGGERKNTTGGERKRAGPDAGHVKVGESTSTAVTTMATGPTVTKTTTATKTKKETKTKMADMKTKTKEEKEQEQVKKAVDGPSLTSKDAKPTSEANSAPPAAGTGLPTSATSTSADSDLKDNRNPNPTTTTTTDTASLGSQATASQAWYSPWAWYGSTTTATVEGGEGGEKDGETEGEAEPKTEAELVKEAALARDPTTAPVPSETKPKSQAPAPDPPKPKLEPEEQGQEGLNPVEQSFETHRGGWAAFFSSRALGMKLITGAGEGGVERDENGMEVMELDFGEEGAEGAGTVGVAADADAGQGKGAGAGQGKGTDAGQGKDTDTARGRAAGKKSTGKGPVAPPLTISDSVKKEVEKAAPKKGSPASSVTNVPVSKHVPKKESQSSVKDNSKKGSTSAPTTRSSTPGPGTRTQVPNLVLPTWTDTFHTAPRNVVPPPQETAFGKTMKFVSGVLFAADKGGNKDKDRGGSVRLGGTGAGTGKGKARAAEEFLHFGQELPRAWDVVEGAETKGKGTAKGKGRGRGTAGGVELDADVLRGCKRVVVIGIHGWFPGAVVRTVLGEPTGTSAKFVNMMVQALEEFEVAHGVTLEKITKIPLEGEGTISGRVQRLYTNLQANAEWMDDLHGADAIIVATHSQGSIVSTHLLDRLIQDGHIRTAREANPVSAVGSSASTGPLVDSFSAAGVEAIASVGANAMAASGSGIVAPTRKPQRICCLALCGIHLGPLRYLSSSSLLLPYIQYFESTAAKELFEFQNTDSEVSKEYVKALSRVVSQGTKMVYVASLNDQVVPIYSGLFTAVSHPLILRALYIDGDAYHSSDFLSNLLVLLLRILNSGISDSGLLAHLSEATAGSLNGVGHSTAYEEISTYTLAVRYLFLTDDGLDDHAELTLEPFNANSEQNDYEIPWSLRDVIADERVAHFFGREISELRDAFREWQPKTTILRDLKRKLQPIQRLPSSFSSASPSPSKL